MGQKVHPYGFRIGVNKGWQSHWYAPDISYSKFVKEDYKLRKYINTRFKEAGVSKVEIERVLPDKISVSIYTAKPGVIIGKGGKEVESLKKELTEI
ncbi:MAG: KH domain-containing protein, partial [Candidatus Hydrothermia bacterium]